MSLTVGSLFAGIGGIELGLERAGMEVVWQVEKDDYCREVLKKHWPDVERFEDVRDVGAENLEPVDLICGGFPCQDISVAGKGEGIEGDRSGLWSEMWRIIRELRPRYALVENVSAISFRGIQRVIGDLAQVGYDAEWSVVSACAVGAPHTRERMFVVAYTDGGDGLPRLRDSQVRTRGPLWRNPNESLSDADRETWMETASSLYGGGDGVPNRVDRLRALGNAVVPQVAEWIGRRIVEHAERVEAEDAA